MTLIELLNALRDTGYPVAFSYFAGENPPSPPFICYLESASDHFVADNKVYHEVRNIQVELYTDKKDTVAENTIESILKEYEIPYDCLGDVWVEDAGLFQRIYEVRLI